MRPEPPSSRPQTLPAALAELDAALRKRDEAVAQVDHLKQRLAVMRAAAMIGKFNDFAQQLTTPAVQEPPLSGSELVAVRQLLEERFGPL